RTCRYLELNCFSPGIPKFSPMCQPPKSHLVRTCHLLRHELEPVVRQLVLASHLLPFATVLYCAQLSHGIRWPNRSRNGPAHFHPCGAPRCDSRSLALRSTYDRSLDVPVR